MHHSFSPSPHAGHSHWTRIVTLFALSAVFGAGCGERDPVGPIATVGVDLSRSAVIVDERLQATAKPRDARGNELPASSVTWSSSAPQVAFVDRTGYVITQGPGTTTITATIDGVSGGAVLTVTDSDLRIDIHGNTNAFSPDSSRIIARVTSPKPLTSVIASSGGRQVALSLTNVSLCGLCYFGFLDLTGLPTGVTEFSVTATDASGRARSVASKLIHDNPPRITWVEPAIGTVARPSVHVVATCSDDSGACTHMELRGAGAVTLAEGSTRIDATVTPAAGVLADFAVLATDRNGQTWASERSFVSEPGVNLTEIATIPQGWLVDLLDSRVLYQSGNGDGYWVRTTSGTPQNISNSAGSNMVRLTPDGAILRANGVVSEWRGGILTPLTVGGRVDTLEVSGSFALWRETGGAQPGIYRRDLKAGTTQLIASGPASSSLASNGDVVSILPSGEMQWLHAGNVVTVPNDLGATQRFRGVTDGVIVAYLATTSASRQCPCSLVVFSNGVTTTVAADLSVSARYFVARGWLAVHRPGPTPDVFHVWSRAPDGTVRQVDQLAGGAFLQALTENGTLVFSGPEPHLYASAPPYATPTDAGTAFAQVLVRDDKIIKLVGRSAFMLR